MLAGNSFDQDENPAWQVAVNESDSEDLEQEERAPAGLSDWEIKRPLHQHSGGNIWRLAPNKVSMEIGGAY